MRDHRYEEMMRKARAKALKMTPAMTGFDRNPMAARMRPSPSTSRAIHVGTASSSSGGAKYASVMCCSMWALYRYVSDRSCIGQSETTQTRAIPTTNDRIWRRVTCSPAAGAIRRTKYQ